MWEVVELVRKLALTSLVLFFSAGSPFQICFALMLSAYAHVAHALYRPFADKSAYYLQHGSLAVTTLVYTAGLLFKVDGFGRGSASSNGVDEDVVLNAIGALLVVACVGFLVMAAIVAALHVRQRLRSSTWNSRMRKLGSDAPWSLRIRESMSPSRPTSSSELELAEGSFHKNPMRASMDKSGAPNSTGMGSSVGSQHSGVFQVQNPMRPKP